MSIRTLLAGLALGVTTAAAASPAVAQSGNAAMMLWPKWGPSIDLDGKVGSQRSIGEADLFVPLWQNERSMLFGNFRFRADTVGSLEGNFGAGFRHMLEDGWNAGAYGYYDHRKSNTGNLFDQLTFGAELLGTNFDVRANYYSPIGQTQQLLSTTSMGPNTASVVGTTVQVTQPGILATYEYALSGFDAEAGVRVPITPAASAYDLRFYAGGYRFSEPTGTVPVVAGPRLRLQFTDYDLPLWKGSRLTAEAVWQTDAVRGSQFFGGLRLRLPFGAGSPPTALAKQEWRMTDPIVRDVDVVSQSRTIQQTPTITEAATTANGKTVTGISSVTTIGAALPGAVTAAGANSFVVLQGTFNTTATTTLQSGQTVMGAGMVTFTTASGKTITASLPGATIAGTVGGGAAVTMGTNSTLTGLTIANTSTTGTFGVVVGGGASVTGATISNNTITATDTGGNSALAVSINAALTSASATVQGNMLSTSSSATNSAALFMNASTGTIIGNSFSGTQSGAPSPRTIDLQNGPTINAGSTGNTLVKGACFNGGGTTGSIGLAGGATCP